MGFLGRCLVIENKNGLELERASREVRRGLGTICLLEEKMSPRAMLREEHQSR